MSSFRGISMIRTLLLVGSSLLTGLTLGTGAHAAEPSAYRFKHYLSSDKSVTSFCKTSSGVVLVGTRDGLYEYLGDNTYGSNVIFQGRSIEYMAQDGMDRIWACSGEVFIYDRRTATQYLAHEVPKLLQVDSLVTEFCQGVNGEMWFSSGRNLYMQGPSGTEKITTSESPIISLTSRGNIVYALTGGGQVLRFTREMNSNIKTLPSFLIPGVSSEEFVLVFVDSSYNVWVSQGPTGVWVLDAQGDAALLSSEKSSPKDRQLPQGYPDAIVEDTEGNVWIGLDHGGICICRDGAPVAHLTAVEEDPSLLISDSVISLLADDEGSVWVGYYKKGISIYSPEESRLSLNESEDINVVCTDSRGNIFLGTDAEGLVRIDAATGNKTVFTKSNSSLGSDVITALKPDSDGGIWIGTYMGGLSYYDGSTIRTYSTSEGLSSLDVWSVDIDHMGRVWLATLGRGVQVLDPVTGKFTSIEGLSNESAFQLDISPEGEVYVGTGFGLNVVDVNSLAVRDVVFPENSGGDMFMGVFYDQHGLLWLNEGGHLKILDTRSGKTFSPYLPGDAAIKGFLEDDDSNVWVVCARNLLRYRVTQRQDGEYDFVCSTLSLESLGDVQFNERSAFRQGQDFLIGSFGGYIRLSPLSYLPASKTKPLDIRLSSLYINKVEIPTGGKPLPVALPYCSKIVLSHKDNTLAIRCEVISYSHELRNTISYQMKGLSDDWIHMEAKTSVLHFPGLRPGRYNLTVKEDNVASDPILLEIVIRHPWYFTIWAYLGYILIVLLLIYIIHGRLEEKKNREIESLQQKQQHTVDEMKMRFFTNISHDFRTTLTLIISPLEEIISAKPELKDNQAISTIYRNATRLQTLVGQLLDIRKIDKQGVELVKVSADIIPVLRECSDSFRMYAEGLQMDYRFITDTDSLVMEFDHDKIMKILTNLLSNAFKYTPKGGSVHIVVDSSDEDRLRISVIDSGCGVPETEKQHIFERFYQSSTTEVQKLYGTGIGLHIVSEFVHLHGGEIIVEDNDPEGSIFSFTIPVVRCASDGESCAMESSSSSSQFSVLIVDDNDDFRSFLRSSLSGDYNVFAAENGLSALEVLKDESIDLVISDVMMPGMDGFELCRRIKSDINISHIPVLLLTAKSMEENHIEGLSSGADDYLTKPFNMSILRFRVAKFIEWKQRTQAHFISQVQVEPEQEEKVTIDDAFIAEATKVITEYMTDPKFSVEKLAESMGMHRTSLYKKIGYLIGKSPLEFIRTVRMKKAAELLLDPKLYISEVAYQVGFNSPKVFALHFKEEFGMSPTEYKKQHAGE